MEHVSKKALAAIANAVDAELTHVTSGDIDILFINPPFHKRSGSGRIFPLGLGYIISSVSKRGYSWELIDCSLFVESLFPDDLRLLRRTLLATMKRVKPRVVGVGPCITTQLRALYVIAECCKSAYPGTPLFAGGPFASIEGQEPIFFDRLGIDWIVKGDGEEAVPCLIDAVVHHGSPGDCDLVSSRARSFFNVVRRLDEVAYPYRPNSSGDAFSSRRVSSASGAVTAAVVGSRGCLHSCAYCVSGNSLRGYSRRSFESIVDEMRYLHDERGVSDVVFYDDCFFPSAKSLAEGIADFGQALHGRGVQMTWQVEMRPDVFTALDEALLLRIEELGCRQINLGVEKRAASGLAFLGKEYDSGNLVRAAERVKRLSSIALSATFILGGRGETEKDVDELVGFSLELALDFAHFNPLFVYPGTPLYGDCFRGDCDWADYAERDCYPWGEIVYESDLLDRETLLDKVDEAYRRFYAGTPYESEAMVTDRFNLGRRRS